MVDPILHKYELDALGLVKQLETAAKNIKQRLADRGMKDLAALHNATQEATSIATDLEVSVAVYRRVKAVKVKGGVK